MNKILIILSFALCSCASHRRSSDEADSSGGGAVHSVARGVSAFLGGFSQGFSGSQQNQTSYRCYRTGASVYCYPN